MDSNERNFIHDVCLSAQNRGGQTGLAPPVSLSVNAAHNQMMR